MKLAELFLTEAIEGGVSSCSSAIESSLDRNYSPHRIVLHIIGENHQLRDVDKAPECLVGHSLVDSVSFSKNSIVIIRFLDFNEGKRKPIHKTSYVWTETVAGVRILTGKLSGNCT
jgi:hypothetical protein